ncbi:MAG: hypothetical protein HY265_08625 [Deltaproteobacteria bacterium]|nr:hypothetical protein [Deltaproteobacteria bacterium]
MANRRTLYLCISSVSMATLAYEVALTRIFSIALWYHFAFMVVSIAMLGIAASGTFASLYPEAKRPERIGRYALFLACAIIIAYLVSNHISFDPIKLSWDRKQILYVAVYYLFLGIPFFFSGLIILRAIEHLSEKAGRIYFFDLLGAAIGSLSILFILNVFDEKGSMMFISAIPLIAVFLLSRGEKTGRLTRAAPFIAAALIIISYTYLPSLFDIKISPYKSLVAALQYPGAEQINTFRGVSSRIDIIKSPAIRYAPGLSLKYTDELPLQIGVAVDGGDLNAVTRFNGSLQTIKFIDYLPSSLPYIIGSNQNILILEPKGGLPVLTAIYYSSKHIDKIESNSTIIKAINKSFSDFSGGIYKENVYSGLGRAWLKTKGRYDIIDINLTSILPWESGSYGLVEDFRLTREAFIDYYRHLKEGGCLSMTLYFLPPARMELRLLSTITSAMEEIGIKDAARHTAAIRSWNTVTILLKRDELSALDINGIKRFARERGFDLVYYPGIKSDESNIFNKLPTNDYFKVVSRIMDPFEREKAIQEYIFDISPPTDEKPFFHHFLKMRNLRETYRLAGSKWQYFMEEGYLIPIIFVQAVVISVLLILLPLFLKKKKQGDYSLQVLIYFSSIGLGFMFLEIAIIQRFMLYLDNPIYAVTIVIAAILLSSGMGSLTSQKISIDKGWRGGVILLLAVIIIVYSILLKHIMAETLGWEFPQRVACSIVLLALLGFFMGMPFPMGIRYLAIRKGKGFIPWAWGINGAFSVAGSIMAAMLALGIGLSGVMFTASVLYLCAFLSIFFAPCLPLAQN